MMATKKPAAKKTPVKPKAKAPKFGSAAFNKLHGVGQFGKKSKGK